MDWVRPTMQKYSDINDVKYKRIHLKPLIMSDKEYEYIKKKNIDKFPIKIK